MRDPAVFWRLCPVQLDRLVRAHNRQNSVTSSEPTAATPEAMDALLRAVAVPVEQVP